MQPDTKSCNGFTSSFRPFAFSRRVRGCNLSVLRERKDVIIVLDLADVVYLRRF